MKNTLVKMRRLGWAGAEIECSGETIVIDYVHDKAPMLPLLHNPDERFPASSQPGRALVALLTHLHADHADPGAIAAALRDGAPVYRPAPATGNKADLKLTAIAEKKFAEQTLSAEVIGVWQERSVGPFRMFTVPAVDGFGDPQLSWIVECGGHRIIHAGDTLNHGNWWRIAHRFGKFDVALLPINAPTCYWPHLQPPSPFEATITPEEAAVAAHIIGAKVIVPIHYGSLNKVPMYVETPHATRRLEDKANEFGIRVILSEPGEWFDLK